MLDQKINEQLGLLQNELHRLKKATDYIDSAKDNSLNIIAELESVQDNFSILHKLFSEYTDKLYDVYKNNIEDLKKSTVFLEKYAGIVDLTSSLLKIMSEIDFKKKLSEIESSVEDSTQHVISALSNVQAVSDQNQNQILEHFKVQRNEFKTIKAVSFITCGFTFLTFFILGIIFRDNLRQLFIHLLGS